MNTVNIHAAGVFGRYTYEKAARGVRKNRAGLVPGRIFADRPPGLFRVPASIISGMDIGLLAFVLDRTLVIPPITYYETLRGLLAVNATWQIQAFEQFCLAMQMPDMGRDDWGAAARLYAELKTKGHPMEDTDLLQAAFCLQHGYTLVTHNTDHFSHVSELALTDWVKE